MCRNLIIGGNNMGNIAYSIETSSSKNSLCIRDIFEKNPTLRTYENYRFSNGRINIAQTKSPTRMQLSAEAHAAFSNPLTEHLTDVVRRRNCITGETVEIAGKIVEPSIAKHYDNFLIKCLNFVKKVIK